MRGSFQTDSPVIYGFPPIADAGCVALVLGTIPGVASLRRMQYYGHPRNAFWPVMSSLLGFSPDIPYESRCRELLSHHIALWDVLECCRRLGSADSDIREARPNDIARLLDHCPSVGHIFFNGAQTERLFGIWVRPTLRRECLRYHRLPSTSPACVMPVEAKRKAWSIIIES